MRHQRRSPRSRSACHVVPHPILQTAAFTLIELLVVIAIIATLISILLPALRGARMSGWKAVSLANIRSIAQAGAGYQDDNKGYFPAVPTGVPVPPTINAITTWGGWGKYNSTFWTAAGGALDVIPASRPLNPYLYDGEFPTDRLAETRKRFQMPGFRDPSDKIGHQQSWNAFSSTFGVARENDDRSSCYDDVGTSYLLQLKWFFQTNRYVGGDWTRAWRLGTDRLRAGEVFQASRMIWVNDEYCDITINQSSDNARIKNGYGDINKAVVAFMDGHAKYIKVIPGGEGNINSTTRPWLVPAYSNSEYTVVFSDLR